MDAIEGAPILPQTDAEASVAEAITSLDPDFSLPWRQFEALCSEAPSLSQATRSLVCLALQLVDDPRDAQGIRVHVEQCLSAGVSSSAVVEVFQLTCLIGIHGLVSSANTIPVGERSSRVVEETVGSRRAQFESARGYWSSHWEHVIALDPEAFDAYLQLCSHPWVSTHIPLATKELIDVAIDALPPHLYESGLETHARNALAAGATLENVRDVARLACLRAMRRYLNPLSHLTALLAAESK